MTITPTALLSLPIITTGTESGTWGDVVDNGLTSYLDIAIAGGLSIAITTADVTLANTAGTSAATGIISTTAQYAILNISGAKTAARSLIVPSSSREYTINNAAATGGFLLTVKGAATTGVTLVDGEIAVVAWNGADYVKIATNLAGVPSINGGQLAGLRNWIINGGMQVSQRGAVSLANNTVQYGGADRWLCGLFAFTTASATQSSIGGQPTTSFSTGYSQEISALTTTGTGSVQFRQRIESINSYALNGKTITISGTVYQDTGSTQSFDVALFKPTAVDNFTTTTLVSSATKSATNAALIRFTQTVTLGSTDASNGLELIINFTAVGAVTSKNFYCGDIQLEIGSVATTFEQRSYGLELMLCQRYALSIPANALYGRFPAAAISELGGAVFSFPVTMRGIPTNTVAPSWTYTNAFGAALQLSTTNSAIWAAVSSAAGDTYFYTNTAAFYSAEL